MRIYPNLKRVENFPLKDMDEGFVGLLDDFARENGIDIFINQGATSSGHSKRSMHYRRPCQAADLYTKDMPLDLFFYLATEYVGQYSEIYQKHFNGVGAYPFWNTPGLHIDMRSERTYWYRDHTGDYHFSPDAEFVLDKLVKIVQPKDLEIDFCDAEF